MANRVNALVEILLFCTFTLNFKKFSFFFATILLHGTDHIYSDYFGEHTRFAFHNYEFKLAFTRIAFKYNQKQFKHTVFSMFVLYFRSNTRQ